MSRGTGKRPAQKKLEELVRSRTIPSDPEEWEEFDDSEWRETWGGRATERRKKNSSWDDE